MIQHYASVAAWGLLGKFTHAHQDGFVNTSPVTFSKRDSPVQRLSLAGVKQAALELQQLKGEAAERHRLLVEKF